ncbi:conjugal transfer protein TraN, partial [Aliivibrio fischeri]
NCPTMPTECTPKTPVCTEGAATKTINGVPTDLDCWKKRIDYQCELTDSCKPLLNPPESTYSFKETTTDISNCTQKTKICGLEILGICLSYDVSLVCEKRDCENRNLVCGESSFCLDGDCYQGEGEKNKNFSEAVAGLGALGAVAEDFSEDTITIFTGKGASCDKKPIGLSDCCADDGWGNDIGLTQCNEEEKGLAEAKKSGLTIELGQYCAEKVLGVCIRKKKSYCQFDSKMARIIQEQGKVQLGLDFGTKKDPVCTG